MLSLRQNLASRILDLEKASLYEKYSEKVGEIVTGEVYQVWKKEVLILDDEENELILPKAEQIPNDFYRKGDTIKAIVKSVEMNNNQPRIILSRTANQFLERLFEQEVPEIFDGLITIKKIVRIPGERAKVAVESYDERIDPVGACVGMKGSRIYSIVKELRNENIDVVNYTANPSLMIQRALNPAKISSITIDEEKMTASVYLKPDQVSLAIGKGGLNIRLSKMLTGYDIDVYREVEEEDVALTEFADEIDGWVIDALKSRLRHGQERAGTPRRGDRRACRPRTGAGAEGRGDPEGRIRIVNKARKEKRQDMGNERKLRLIQVAKEFKVGLNTVTTSCRRRASRATDRPTRWSMPRLTPFWRRSSGRTAAPQAMHVIRSANASP